MATNNNQEQAMEATLQLIQNRMGMQPRGVVFTVNNQQIEKAILDYFRANKMDPAQRGIYVRAIWNAQAEREVRINHKNVIPLRVSCIVRANKNRNQFKGNDTRARIMRAIQRGLDEAQSDQVDMMVADDVNKTIQPFALLTKKNEVRWHQAKKHLMTCELDVYKVLEYVFSTDEMQRKPVIDILNWKVPKNNRSFVLNVLCMYKNDNFKSNHGDILDELYR